MVLFVVDDDFIILQIAFLFSLQFRSLRVEFIREKKNENERRGKSVSVII